MRGVPHRIWLREKVARNFLPIGQIVASAVEGSSEDSGVEDRTVTRRAKRLCKGQGVKRVVPPHVRHARLPYSREDMALRKP
jgi:hypothetical protein